MTGFRVQTPLGKPFGNIESINTVGDDRQATQSGSPRAGSDGL